MSFVVVCGFCGNWGEDVFKLSCCSGGSGGSGRSIFVVKSVGFLSCVFKCCCSCCSVGKGGELWIEGWSGSLSCVCVAKMR